MDIYFTNRDELTKVCLQDVMYIKADGNYSVVCYKSGRTLSLLSSLQSVRQLLKETEPEVFIPIGRSHIVNVKYVSQINTAHKTIVVADDNTKEHITLHVSKGSINVLRDAMQHKIGDAIEGFDTKNGNMKASTSIGS